MNNTTEYTMDDTTYVVNRCFIGGNKKFDLLYDFVSKQKESLCYNEKRKRVPERKL